MNLRSGGRVLVTDMYLPETKTRWGAIRKSVARFVARNFYHQNFGGSVLPNLERYFETVEILHRPNLMAYAFLGRRRDEPLEALRTS